MGIEIQNQLEKYKQTLDHKQEVQMRILFPLRFASILITILFYYVGVDGLLLHLAIIIILTVSNVAPHGWLGCWSFITPRRFPEILWI